jgi:hypothetical protein
MKLYFAAAYALDCYLLPMAKKFDKEIKTYLAGLYAEGKPNGRLNTYFDEENVKLYFATLSGGPGQYIQDLAPTVPNFWSLVYMLESFYYIKPWQTELIPNLRGFMLDSGAYTFMQNTTENIDWDLYVDKYIEFIKEHNIKMFIELDIDQIVGLKTVEKYRRKIEQKVGSPCIPVWHKSRGIDYLKGLAKEYKYIGLGGLAIKVIKKSEYKYLPTLIEIAHKENCKIHGLGFSNMEWIRKLKWDSIDTATWLYGNMAGHIYKYQNGKIYKKVSAQRLKTRETAQHNFLEWVKFALYWENHQYV